MPVRQDRIRFEDLEVSTSATSRCAAKVVLAWPTGEGFVGKAEGEDSPHGKLRCAAEATAQALALSANRSVDVVVLTIRAIEELDTVLAVVQLSSTNQTLNERLVGSCLMKGQPPRGAALAVLTATNRMMQRVAYSEPGP